MSSILPMHGAAGPPVAGAPQPGLPTPPPPPPPPLFNVDMSGTPPIFFADVAPPPTAPPAAAPPSTSIDPDALAALVADLRQAANTGSQGASVRSNAADIAARSDRISRILEKQLEEATRPGFGDIIASAMDTLAGQGKVSFAGALAQREGQELTRAYNIANALSGLQRRNQEQLVEVALPGGQKIQVSGAAALNYLKDNKAKNAGAKQALDLLERASRQFADPPAAMAVMAGVLAEQSDPTTSAAQAMANALNDARVARMPRKPAKTDDGSPPGAVRNADGYWVPTGKNRRLSQAMILANAALAGGDRARSDQISERMMNTAAEGTKGGQAGDKFSTAVLEAQTATRLIGTLRDSLDKGAPTGAVGTLARFVDGMKSQINQLSQGQITFGEGTNTSTTTVRELQSSPFAVENIWSRLTRGTPLENNYNWMAQESAVKAQALKTNYLLLAFSVARSIEPGGRLSNQDIQNVLGALSVGGNFQSPNQMKAALNAVEDYVVGRIQDQHKNLVDTSKYRANRVPATPFEGYVPHDQRGVTGPQTVPSAPGPVQPFVLSPEAQKALEKYRPVP